MNQKSGKNKYYLYELHAHTAQVSQCSRISANDLVEHYSNIGCSGICITDHFINGNTLVQSNIPWKSQVEQFCRGYEQAALAGAHYGLQVFFGWEFSYRGTDLLTYGLEPEWLLSHPDLPGLELADYCDTIHDHGGTVIHAHPFREASYIDMIRLLPRRVDAVEIDNCSRTDQENFLAKEFASHYGLPGVFGTDNHLGKVRRYGLAGLPTPAESLHELLLAIVSGKAQNIILEDPV